MLRKIVWGAVVAVATLSATSAFAADGKGKFSLGYFNPAAPVGGRYLLNDKVGLDLGIGFAQAEASDDPTTSAVGDAKKNLQFHLEAGIPYTVVAKGNAHFFVRPGVLYKAIPTYNMAAGSSVYTKKTESEIRVSAILGVEYFPAENFSLSVGHGLEFVSTKGVSANQMTTGTLDSHSSINALQALDITKVGFHFYF